MVQTLNSDSFLFYFGVLSAAAPSFGWMLFLRYLVGFYIGGVPQVCANQGRPFGDCLLLSALLHRPCKAAGYAVPTATAPLHGLLHCLPCVARLKEASKH